MFFCYFRGCSDVQNTFQSLATNVNKNLKWQVEMQNNNDVTLDPERYTALGFFATTYKLMFSYLAHDEVQTDEFLEEMWNKFGRFANNENEAANCLTAMGLYSMKQATSNSALQAI